MFIWHDNFQLDAALAAIQMEIMLRLSFYGPALRSKSIEFEWSNFISLRKREFTFEYSLRL